MRSPFPETIKKIAIIAPSGPPDLEKLNSGTTFLESLGLEIVVMSNALKGNTISYLSASIQERIDDLHAAWKDTTIDLILCARGGYGSAQLLPHIDWKLLRQRAIPFLGYSDITALHLAMIAQNVSTPISAPMACDIEQALQHDITRNSLAETLSINHSKLNIKQIAANLSVFCSLIGTPYMPDLSGIDLIFEDIGEEVYKIDRMLTQIQLSGIANNCASISFGHFTDNGDNEELNKLFKRFAATTDLPVKTEIPFGHTRETLCFIQG